MLVCARFGSVLLLGGLREERSVLPGLDERWRLCSRCPTAGRAGTVQPASRLASDCLRTADGPGSPLPDVNVVLTPGNP